MSGQGENMSGVAASSAGAPETAAQTHVPPTEMHIGSPNAIDTEQSSVSSMEAPVNSATIRDMQKSIDVLTEQVKQLLQENANLKKPSKTSPCVLNPNVSTVDQQVPNGENMFNSNVDLMDIDKKDVEAPSKYLGDVSTWRHWFQKLRTFLTRRDPRWAKLVDIINSEKISNNPITVEVENFIFNDLNVTGKQLMNKFKEQFYEYLETYTGGITHGSVIAGGPPGCIEVFRQLCDEGRSKRPRHMRKEYRALMHPKQASFDNIKKAIMEWETDLAHYQTAAVPWTMTDRDRTMCLEDM